MKMKTMIAALTVACTAGFGVQAQPDTVKIDTATYETCSERGHVMGDIISRTLMYCPPYTIDTDSTTVIVYPGCNSISYRCARCGMIVSDGEKERRVVVWRRYDR
jgi:hypothetical protein